MAIIVLCSMITTIFCGIIAIIVGILGLFGNDKLTIGRVSFSDLDILGYILIVLLIILALAIFSPIITNWG